MIKVFIFSIFILFSFSACVQSKDVTKEECKKQGLNLKKEKVLNYRTGKYELRALCK